MFAKIFVDACTANSRVSLITPVIQDSKHMRQVLFGTLTALRF